MVRGGGLGIEGWGGMGKWRFVVDFCGYGADGECEPCLFDVWCEDECDWS